MRRRSSIAARSFAVPGSGSPTKSTSAFPRPKLLHYASPEPARLKASSTHFRDCAYHVASVRKPFVTERMLHTFLGEDVATAGLGAQRQKFGIGAIHRYSEAKRQLFFQIGGVEGNEMSAVDVEIRERIRSIKRGRSRSFCVSGRAEPSIGETRKRRLRAWLGITPGNRSR